jgi:hypothetical protein
MLPISITGTAAVVNVLVGGQPAPGMLASWPSLFLTFALLLLVPGIGGAWCAGRFANPGRAARSLARTGSTQPGADGVSGVAESRVDRAERL